jgi:thiamine pyrophosphate-dependent acetolactate synthase large subunit-like protein
MTMLTETDGKLARREVAKRLLDGQDDTPLITGLSVANYDACAARGADAPSMFNMHGALGGAPMIGLGLALAQPDKRIFVTMGDFDTIMGMRGLATIATQAPKNLSIAVFDNSICAETGGQPTATGGETGVDLAAIARSCNWKVARTVTKEEDVDQAIDDLRNAEGPVFICFKVSPTHPGPIKKSRDAVLSKLKFRKWLLGSE